MQRSPGGISVSLPMKCGKSPKAGIYFSHYECFGHISRVMAVGEVFKERFPQGDLFFIQAGGDQPLAKLDQLGKVFSLPGAFMDRRHFRGPLYKAAANTAERSKLCEGIISRQKPDLLITELFPLGFEECRFELIPALVKARAQGAALWGISGYPVLSPTEGGWRKQLFKLYQRIIILAPSSEKEFIAGSFSRKEDRSRYLDFFEEHKKVITFAGYLLPQQEVVSDDRGKSRVHPPAVIKKVCRVAVLRGGGAVYPQLIAEAVVASDLLGKEYHCTVVAGPATTRQEWSLFTALVGKKKINNVLLLKSVGDYEGLIEKSDVCVSMAGYHSSVTILKHRKRSVLVPFEGYGAGSFYEQPARARMLQEMIGAKILSFEKLSAVNLARTIKESAFSSSLRVKLPAGAFKGREVLTHALTGLFGQEP